MSVFHTIATFFISLGIMISGFFGYHPFLNSATETLDSKNYNLESSVPISAPKTGTSTPTADAINTVLVKQNSFYINGKLVAQNLPALLGLAASTWGQSSGNITTGIKDYSNIDEHYQYPSGKTFTGFFPGIYYNFVDGGKLENTPTPLTGTTLDAYTSPLLSPDKTRVGFIYLRVMYRDEFTGSNGIPFAGLFVYSSQGAASKTDLNKFLDGKIDYRLMHSSSILYVGNDDVYLDIGKPKSGSGIYRIQDGVLQHVAEIDDAYIISPKRNSVAFYPEISTEVYVAEDCDPGPGNTHNLNEIRLLDFPSGKVTVVIADSLKPHGLAGWSRDGKKLIVLEGRVNPALPMCLDRYTTFFTYDISRNTLLYTKSSDPQSALDSICSGGDYACIDTSDAFRARNL